MGDVALELNEQSFSDLEVWQQRHNYLEPCRAAFLDGWEQGRRRGEARLESQLASTREKLERYEGLYERAVEDLKDIQNWHGNDYCMRDMAKESLMRLDHYHKTGEALI